MSRRCPGPGTVACCAQAPARSSKASASRRCKVRRNVDSEGTTPVTPSTCRVCPSASAAHSAMAVNDRAPATTAHSARPKIPASWWRTPRRCRGSATLASIPGNPGCSPVASAASSARWPRAGSIGDDGGAGMAPRERSGWRENRHDHPKGRARTLTRPSPACRQLQGHHQMTLPIPCHVTGGHNASAPGMDSQSPSTGDHCCPLHRRPDRYLDGSRQRKCCRSWYSAN